MTTPAPTPPGSSVPLTRLRAGTAKADPRTVERVLLAIALVTFFALAVAFTVAGAHKNDQINQLHHHGVPVRVTVTGCLGLLGGSGSNGAGYTCTGHYSVGHHTYTVVIPGLAFHHPGAPLAGKAVPSDPGLFSTAKILAGEHASANVYILPAVFFALFVILTAVALHRRRVNRS